MSLKIKTPPAIEPISLVEAKAHLRLNGLALEDSITTEQSIAPGAHVIAASYSLEGNAVEVSGYEAIVNLVAGTNGAGGTVTVKIQEREDLVTGAWVDWGTAFTAVTEANDNATYEKAYTGSCRYIRAVATVAGATCSFGVDVVKMAGPAAEDDAITSYIKAARHYAEWTLAWRSYITQTLELWRDDWPEEDFIKLLQPPVQEPAITAGSFAIGTVYRILTVGTTDFTLIGATSNTVGAIFTATGAGSGTGTATASGIVRYYGTDDTVYYLDGSVYGLAKEDQYAPKIALKYGQSWPSTTLRPYQAICITYIAGYGDAATDVPPDVINGLKLLISDAYENRGDIITGTISSNLKRAQDLICGAKAY